MSIPEPSIRINVDVTNPGQFFACCGLLELADRLWPGAEGWFTEKNTSFAVSSPCSVGSFSELIEKLSKTGLEGQLSPELKDERKRLENKKHRLKREKKTLPKHEERRRKELGTLLREGSLRIGGPFNLHLDWWQNDDDSNPKTWAGSQQVLRIAQAALQDTVCAFKSDNPFDFCRVMRPFGDKGKELTPSTSKRGKKKAKKDKVEPFYFDSRHGANALPLDIGFSPNKLGMESKAFPAVELLCLIGLQRCRPKPTHTPLVFEYFPWPMPLPISVAPAAVYGVLGQLDGYRFENAYRTDQRKHKGYLSATPFRR
jgi:hypothetical protein